MIQQINIGTVANDGTGDTVRDAFDKVNDNFSETTNKGGYTGTAQDLNVAKQNIFEKGNANGYASLDSSGLVPTNQLPSFFIKSNESLSLAQRKGDVLYGILDQYTGEEITLSKVTGTPTVDGIIYFQLGSEYFRRNYAILNKKWFGGFDEILHLGNGTFSADDSQILINRNLTTGGTATGFHALRDETLYDTDAVSGLRAYASFDSIPILEGTAHFNHVRSFQARPNYSGSDTIDEVAGLTYQSTLNNGVVDYNRAIFIDDFLGDSVVNQNVGLYIKPLLKGVSNFAIFCEGTSPSYFGGNLQTSGIFRSFGMRLDNITGVYGQIPSLDGDGNIIGNPNLTIINGILDLKSGTEARVKASATNLALEALYNIQFFTTSDAGSEKMRLNYAGNLELLKLPPTSDSAYDLLTRNTSTGVVEKVTKNTINRLTSYTVGTLPVGTLGDTAMVTDATSPTYLGALTGGGAVNCPVFYNGTAWVSH